ncbi:MAG TPA: hypothetical protein VEP94_01755 [Solirubrobacterales bacterium]|nr:hypothetical protein [Solirubrobacterales bacterium]
MPGQKPPDGLPPLFTPEPLPVPPLPLPLEPPGDVPPLLPLEPPVVDVVVVELVVVVVVVGCVVDVDVVDDRVVVGWGFGIVRVVVGVVSARGACVVVVGSEPLPQPVAALAATAVATRAMANLRLRGACALRSVRAALRLTGSRLWRAGEGRSRGSR